MPKYLVILLLTTAPSHQLMALEFSRGSSDIQPESISCEVLKEYYPEINCSTDPNQHNNSDAHSEDEVILNECTVESSKKYYHIKSMQPDPPKLARIGR